MSVEAPKTVEETPVVDATKAVDEQPETAVAAPVENSAAPVENAPATEPTPAVATEETGATPVTEEVKKDEAMESVPVSEGNLGYKEPGFFKKFIYSKHFFWFSEEPSSTESLSAFLRQEKEKADTKHSSAAWARETGKGLLFYAKRPEDKASPAGIINLSEASAVTKEGLQFSFRVGTHQHRFEATTSKERDGWLVAIEKAIEEAKELKDELTARESYKKNVEEYSKPTIAAPVVPKTSRSKSKEPKKSIDTATATAATTTAPVAAETASTSSKSSDEATKTAKKDKERSQSRKRGSIFGNFLGKKDEHAEKKEVKEEKNIEAEEKKEEAKASDEPTATPAVEAAEASAAAAAVTVAPAAVVATSDKKEDKEEGTPSPAEKKSKRGSVFGSLFKKNVTSPTTEKTEKDATTSDVPPVSETAPKLDEPIENKPIDTAAVTAPADNVESPAASTEPTKDATTPAAGDTATTPKAEKKGGILGFIKKTEAKLEGKKEHKEEAKEEQAGETIAKDPVAAAAVPETSTEPTTDNATEAASKEERPARDNQRRTSLFFKNKKETTSDAEGTTETKREKSPLPGKFIGNLVRRASKAVKSEPKEKSATEAAPAEPATKDVPVETTPATTEATESNIVGDVVPETLHTTPETAAPAAAPEVKATA